MKTMPRPKKYGRPKKKVPRFSSPTVEFLVRSLGPLQFFDKFGHLLGEFGVNGSAIDRFIDAIRSGMEKEELLRQEMRCVEMLVVSGRERFWRRIRRARTSSDIAMAIVAVSWEDYPKSVTEVLDLVYGVVAKGDDSAKAQGRKSRGRRKVAKDRP